MTRYWLRTARFLALLLVLATGPGLGMATAAAPSAQADDDEAAFNDLVQEQGSLPIVFGPESGELVHDPDKIAFSSSGVDLQDLGLHVDFVNPYDSSDTPWDFGVLFRFVDQDNYYGLIVRSTGDWTFSAGTGDAIQDGTVSNLQEGAGDINVVDLIAVGDVGYFSINDTFVSALDLSALTESGDVGVGSSFLTADFQEGAVTGFENFVIWSFDEGGSGTPTEEATEEASAEATEEASPEATSTPGGRIGRSDGSPTAESSPEPTEAASPVGELSTYESPTFGYSFRFDETWAIEDESSEDGTDYVRVGNGISTLDISGYASDASPDDCVQSELDYFSTTEGYSDVQVALDTDNNEMRGVLEDELAFAVIWFAYSSDESTPINYTAYVECRAIEQGVSQLRIVQFVDSEDYNNQIESRVAVLDSIQLASDGTVTPEATSGPEERATATTEVVVTAEPTAEASATTSSGGDGAAIGVRIAEVDDSGVSGLATLTSDGERTTVNILVLDAPEGALALIHSGTCADLDPAPEFLLRDIEGGSSETTIAVTLSDLTDAPFAIAIHGDVDDLSQPLACGEIG